MVYTMDTISEPVAEPACLSHAKCAKLAKQP